MFFDSILLLILKLPSVVELFVILYFYSVRFFEWYYSFKMHLQTMNPFAYETLSPQHYPHHRWLSHKTFLQNISAHLLFLTLYSALPLTLKMADQAPNPFEPRDIPEIQVRTKIRLKLTKNQAFGFASRRKFKQLSVNSKQKLLFQLPIPAIKRHTGGESSFSKSKSRSTSGSTQIESNLAELLFSDRNKGGEFTIEGRTFKYEYSSYEHVYQFLTPIWKNNQMSEDDFFSKYVQPYLDRRVNYAKLYLGHDNGDNGGDDDDDDEEDEDVFLNFFQNAEHQTNDENEVERVLQRCLYNPIGKPLLESLEHFKDGANEGLPEASAKKGLDKSLKKTVKISPPVDANISLIPFFNTTHTCDLKMLGLSMVPDASLGYYFDEVTRMVGVLVGYIEVKAPTFGLEVCYKNLTRDLPDSDIPIGHLGISSLKSKTLEFLKTVRNYCTMCVHTGCNRFILVDYDSYLFVHLDESMSLVQKDQQEEFLQMTAEQIVGSEKSEMQRTEDQLAEEDPGEGRSSRVNDASIAGKGRKEKSKIQESEAPKVQSSNNDNTTPESWSSFPLQLIDGRQFWVSRKHPHARLYVLAFLAMNKSRWDEIKAFRENVITVMEVEKEKTEREEEAKHNTLPGSQNTSAKRQKTASQNTRGSLSMALSPSRDDSYYFEKNAFEVEYKIDFGPIRHSLLRVAAGMNSQVISIYSKKFIEKLSPIHPIFRKGIPKDIPDISVLKIFDPYWGKALDDDEDYTYPDGVAMCTHELKVYEKLKDLMGSYVPWIFTYGRTVDIHVASGQRWPRFWGSFIQMEYFEPDRTFAKDIPVDFVLDSIIPVYERLHKGGVVQNDFKLSNLIITKDHHEVKIIDFSSAIITNDENLFKEEIRDIKRYFKIST